MASSRVHATGTVFDGPLAVGPRSVSPSRLSVSRSRRASSVRRFRVRGCAFVCEWVALVTEPPGKISVRAAMSKRDHGGEFVVPVNDTGRALFVRDQHGNLVTVLPGAPMPAKAQAASEASKKVAEKAEAVYEEKRLEERTEEDIQYEAYLQGKKSNGGKIYLQNAGMGASDRSAFQDSLAAEVAEARESEGKEYKPSRAYDRGAKMKKQSGKGNGGFLGGTSVEAAKLGAQKANEAMARALENSDDDDDDDGTLHMNAVQMANRAMEMYNLPISNLAQVDVHGNDLRLPKLQRKLRK